MKGEKTLKNVSYVDASTLPKEEQSKINLTKGLVAIETYNDKISYELKPLENGAVAYILEYE